MVLQFPLTLANGAPVFVGRDQELACLVEAAVETQEGTYYTNPRRGIQYKLFGPAVGLRYEILNEITTTIPGASVPTLNLKQNFGEVTYDLVVTRQEQVTRTTKTILL